MATQSASTPRPEDEKTQDPVTELEQPTSEDQQDANAQTAKQNSASVFVNSEPMREEQVQNAVKFLSHPKVRGSPVIYRRSFLERKGLTKEEIDEAFRRVPDPPPSTQVASVNQDGQVKSSSNIQQQAPTQILQPATAAPTSVISSAGTLARYQFHWSHAFLAVGFLAVSGAGTAILFKKSIVPRLKSWIRKVVLAEEEEDLAKKNNLKPTLAEEAAVAAKAAAAAAADVAKASQEMLNSRNEEKRYFGEFMNLLDVQVQEIKSLSSAIQKLEGQANAYGGSPHQDHKVSIKSSKQPNANGKADYLHSVRSSSPPGSVEPSIAPHPTSYMEEFNDLPSNPNQQPSNTRLAPRTKHWEVNHTQNSSSQVLQSQTNGEAFNSNGATYQLNGGSSVPWWQQKNGRIAEIENEDELKTASYGTLSTAQPVQRRRWVPPQPPPVAMAEAVEAIRRPKSLVQKEQSADDQSVSQLSDVSDELQRITRVSESGGAVEINGGNSGLHQSEILEEKEQNYEGN